jgi:hypothetical protein
MVLKKQNKPMKRFLFLFGAFLLLTGFSAITLKRAPQVQHFSFKKGEELHYRIRFGFFNVGNAQMKIHAQTYLKNGQPCYKVDTYGKTSGMVDWVAKVDNQWGAYVDTLSLLPQMAYRHISENKYEKHEEVTFDHKTKQVKARVKDNKTGKFKEPVTFEGVEGIREIMSSYLYLRTVDFQKLRPGETFTITAFYEDTVYDLDIVFAGREEVKTKAGKFKAIKLVPVVPDNKLFNGKNAVTAWVSDDAHRYPVKVEANMFVGKAGFELTEIK